MANEFQSALQWHMQQDGTTIADLVKGAGVSRDVVNKLLYRDNASTTAENAMLIAAFYGKTVNQFIMRQDVSDIDRAVNLFSLLAPEDLRTLEAQIQGILARRARQSV